MPAMTHLPGRSADAAVATAAAGNQRRTHRSA
jgi:hypothetical protein